MKAARLRFFLVACVGFLSAFVGTSATSLAAEAFPSRPIKVIVGQGPGTTSDIVARVVGAKLEEILGQPVVIEGRSGAAGTIAATVVANAPPDGYTLLLASSANLALAANVVEGLRYDPVKDFAPIGRIARIPWALGANANLPVRDIPELIAYAKAHPGRLTGGSTGPGSQAAWGIDTLNRHAGIDILNVSYRTSAASLQGLLSGEIDMVFTDVALLAPHVKQGTLHLLAAASAKRLRAFPDLPTLGEQGVGDIVIEPWYELVAPAGTPAGVISALSASLAGALRAPDVRERLLGSGYDLIEETPAEFASAIKADVGRFSAAPIAEQEQRRGR